jgi:hypothetical protein
VTRNPDYAVDGADESDNYNVDVVTVNDQYKALVAGLRLAAASSSQQLAALPEYVCVTDEVASTFGDAFMLVPQLVRAGLVCEDAARALETLDRFFENAPDDSNVVPSDILKHDPFWAEARRLAAVALDALGEPPQPLELCGIAWIKGS